MSFEIAVIKSEQTSKKPNKKIYGLYPLERNIFVLRAAGIKKIYLDLSKEEKELYNKKIKPRLKRASDIDIFDEIDGDIKSNYLLIPSNLFMQARYLAESDNYFNNKKNIAVPTINEDQFLLIDDKDFRAATRLAKQQILDNTEGYIARNINKKVSIPMSTVLSRTGIHPNYLTIFNLIIGVLSSVFLLFNSYWYTVLGGCLFQLASVLDGVDGEVAKFTFKTSKIGSWLDTITDNSTLFLFLGAASHLYYKNFEGLTALIYVAIIFIGSFTMLHVMFRYLKRHSSSRSLVTYDKEFIQKLPKNDPVVFIVNTLKYLTKKEFFSFVFLGIALTGRIYYLVPLAAFCILLATVLLVIIDVRYLDRIDDIIRKG